jgi:hypothetical protein
MKKEIREAAESLHQNGNRNAVSPRVIDATQNVTITLIMVV